MSEASLTTEPATPKTRATRNGTATAVETPAAVEEAKKTTITITFEAKDAVLYRQIVADAEEDERTPSGMLIRFIRSNYPNT